MNKFVSLGLGAAAVVVALVIGIRVLSPSTSGGVGSASSAAPSPTPAPTATTEPSPSNVGARPLTQSFTSTVHGISLSYPEEWRARAASEPWTARPDLYQFIDPGFDVLYHPTLTDHLFVEIVSHPVADSTPADWVAAQLAGDGGCQATEPITVDGAAGLIGAGDCKIAAITKGGRGYRIALTASQDDPAAVAPYDMVWFQEVLSTVKLHPEDAVDAKASPSS